MIAGDTFGIIDDNDYNLAGPCIVDQLEAARISWKAYQEDLPPFPCFNSTLVTRKEAWYNILSFIASLLSKAQSFHLIPKCAVSCFFEIMDNILIWEYLYSFRNNKNWCSKIVEASQLAIDIANNALPQYSFYTPNIDNDGTNSLLI